MNITDLITGGIGSSIISTIANKLGIEEGKAKIIIAAAVPLMIAALKYNSNKSESNAQGISSALDNHAGNSLDNIGNFFSPATEQDGNKIVNHMFGQNTDGVAQSLSQKTGIGMSQIGPILAVLAPIVMAYLGRQKAETNTNSGGLGDLLGGLLGGGNNNVADNQAPQAQTQGGGLMDMVSGFFDKNKDGSALDDIAGMFFKK